MNKSNIFIEDQINRNIQPVRLKAALPEVLNEEVKGYGINFSNLRVCNLDELKSAINRLMFAETLKEKRSLIREVKAWKPKFNDQ